MISLLLLSETMRKVVLILCFWFICSSIVFNPTVRAVFAVNITIQPNSQLYGITVYINNGRVLSHKKTLTREEFIKYASGKWPSIYNPTRVNMLEQNKIPCGLAADPVTKKDLIYCSPLDSLWKLRFSDYPFKTSTEKGWSSDLYKPSEKQILFLNEKYHLYDIEMGQFIDSSFWSILRDVQDPDWIKKYKSLR